MIDKIGRFWILVHLEVIKLCSKLGEEIASTISEKAHGGMSFSINANELCLVNSLAHQKSRAQIICLSYLIQFVCLLHLSLNVS